MGNVDPSAPLRIAVRQLQETLTCFMNLPKPLRRWPSTRSSNEGLRFTLMSGRTAPLAPPLVGDETGDGAL